MSVAVVAKLFKIRKLSHDAEMSMTDPRHQMVQYVANPDIL